MNGDLVLFSSSIASGVESQLNAVNDSLYSISDNGVYITQRHDTLLWSMGYGANIVYSKYKKVQFSNLDYPIPVSRNLDFWKDPVHFINVVNLDENESLKAYAYQDSGVNQTEYVLSVLGKDIDFASFSEVSYLWKLTGNISSANAWDLVSLTPSIELPSGEYNLVGAIAIASNGVGARLFHPDFAYRPPINLIANEYELGEVKSLFKANMTFKTTNIPKIEIYSTTTGSITVYFLLG